MTNLSPAAQAVLDAFLDGYIGFASNPGFNVAYESDRNAVAAALQAVADLVLPEEPLHGGDQRWMYERDTRQESRKKLLAIAAELEAQ
jgi:hypothetical protein